MFFFFKQKTAYDMRISDWSSDVCSSDLAQIGEVAEHLDRRHQLDARVIAALEAKGEHPAALAAQIAFRERVIGVVLQPGIGHPVDLRVRAQPLGECQGVAAIGRERVVLGKRVSVGVDLGGRRDIKKKKKTASIYKR